MPTTGRYITIFLSQDAWEMLLGDLRVVIGSYACEKGITYLVTEISFPEMKGVF